MPKDGQHWRAELVRALGSQIGTAEQRARFAADLLRRLAGLYVYAREKHSELEAADRVLDSVATAARAVDSLRALTSTGPTLGAVLRANAEHVTGANLDDLSQTLFALHERAKAFVAGAGVRRGDKPGPRDTAGAVLAQGIARLYLAIFHRMPSHTRSARGGTPFDRICDTVQDILLDVKGAAGRVTISDGARRKAIVWARGEAIDRGLLDEQS